MGKIFFLFAMLLFFFAAAGVSFPNPTAWGLFFLATAFLVGDWTPWRKS